MIRSAVHCTNCCGDFIVEMDLSVDGNHEIICPLCRHTHYRVVENGEVTEERWRSSSSIFSGATITTTTYTVSSMMDTTAISVTNASSSFTYALWMDRTDLNLVTSGGTA